MEEEVWIALAELFFLDTESDQKDFVRVSKILITHGWDKKKTNDTLIQLIAPIAGANLGYLIFPANGEWAGFDKKDLCEKINLRKQLRDKYSKRLRFVISDWWSQRMLRKLKVDNLLELLP